MCCDPDRAGVFFISTGRIIYRCDTQHEMNLLAGSASGAEEGVGERVCFPAAFRMVYRRATNELIVSDHFSGHFRTLNVHTRQVKAIRNDADFEIVRLPENTAPVRLAFDRSPAVKPETELFVASNSGVYRFVLYTKQMSRIESTAQINVFGIAATPTGHLLLSSCTEQRMYLVDPISDTTQLLAGGAAGGTGSGYSDGTGKDALFSHPTDITIVDCERCVYVVDAENYRIRRIDLPVWWFVTATN